MTFGIEDKLILENLEALGFRPEVIYDIGASNGSWTIICAEVFPHSSYLLFEPLARRDQSYREGIETLLDSEIDSRVFDVVCGGADAEGSFHQSTYEYGSVGSSSILTGELEGFKALPAKIRSLDSLQREESLPKPDLMKMDVQGAEMEVLKGAETLLNSCSVLFVESWISRGYGSDTPLLSELISWLDRRNFSLFDFGGQYRMGNPSVLVSQDVVFVRSDSELGQRLNQDYHDRRSRTGADKV